MNDQGYIMIPRSIFHTWLWDNPIYYQWYSDLYGLAAYKERSTLVGRKIVHLHRGQLVGSIQFFISRWGRSKTMILNFFELLQSDGYIIKESSHNISVITIVHYFASNNYVQEDNLLYNPLYSESKNYDNTKDDLRNNYENSPEYDLSDNPENNHEDSPDNNHRDNSNDNIEKKSEEKEKIEKKEIKKERIDSSTTTSSICEQKNFFEESIGDDNWKKTIASRFQIEESAVSSFLDLFRQDQEARGRTEGHTDIHDFKSHFCDWLRKELGHQSKRHSKGNRTVISPTPSPVPEVDESVIKDKVFKIVGMKLYMMYFKGLTTQISDGVVTFSSPYPECGIKVKEWQSKIEATLQMKVKFFLLSKRI